MPDKRPCIPDALPIENIERQKLAQPIESALLELGRFDGVLSAMINPRVLLSPLTQNEAVLSSKIEGTQVSLTEVLEYEAHKPQGEGKENDIREVINYRHALQGAEESVGKNGKITLHLIRQLHKRLMQDVRGGDQKPGHFRKTQNWIGKKGDPMEKARFIPPDPGIMRDHLENWVKFMNSPYRSPLVQLAFIHAQFEIIHPFDDGNGRLGRMLVPLFMYQKGLLRQPVFYISEYLSDNDREYRDRLLAITEKGDWSGWLLFFLTAILEQTKANNDKASKMLDLYEDRKEKFRESTRSQFSQAALDAFFQSPILNSTKFMELSGIEIRPTAYNILRQLEKASLIRQEEAGSGRRPAVYVLPELIAITEGIGKTLV